MEHWDSEGVPQNLGFTTTLSARFLNEAHASLGAAVLRVDPELNPERVSKVITSAGEYLTVTFQAVDVRSMRLSVSAFLDCLGVVFRTLRDFGEEGTLNE